VIPEHEEAERFVAARARMVEEQLRSRGIRDARVLEAMGSVPRHRFVAADVAERAYDDCALPTEQGQTISQPWIVARMIELAHVEALDTVLEIGTGSGYQTVLLAKLAAHVWSVERIGSLLESARARLASLGVGNVSLRLGDGSEGWRDFGPYARVVAAAAAPHVPEALQQQLRIGGVLVIPVGGRDHQHLETWHRVAEHRWEHRRHGECRFVPLLGRDAWQDASDSAGRTTE
jgi:protein-L-isoaspartate(D-aspartate) O-methyltransferase